MKRFRSLLAVVVLGVSVLGCGVLRGGGRSKPDPKPDPKPGAVDPGDRALMRVHEIDQQAHPMAVCNDGSTPVYFHRPGKGDGATKWVVFLKGGGACGDRETCSSRGAPLTSATPWLRRGTLGPADNVAGIVDPNPNANPDFHDWNHVYVPYCSSDIWTGDRGASDETFGMHFRGYRIVDAVFDSLDLSGATELLLAGSSAGGLGVLHNADRVAKELGDGVRFAALADSGFNPTSNRDDLKKPYGVWNPQVEPDCAAANTSAPWRCLEGLTVLENDAVQAKLFVQQSQFDPNFLQKLERGNPEDRKRLERGVANLKDVMEKQDGSFCPSDMVHVTVEYPLFMELSIDGTTLAEAVGDWYHDRGREHCIIDRDAKLPPGPPARGPGNIGSRPRRGR